MDFFGSRSAARADELGSMDSSGLGLQTTRSMIPRMSASLTTEKISTNDRPLHARAASPQEFESELLVAADATELLDVLGLLGDVLREAASADEWLGL